ncbi:MAG: hypothetical protein J5760_02065, partial [Clostridia bacterium]|nr:hypothetical protein [Clostridia bacterium]
MFNNIGKKIKVFAIVIFILFALADIAVGIVLLATARHADDFLPIALPIMLVGPVLAWITSCFVYGFGELIDKTSEVARNTRHAGPAPAAPFAPPEFGMPYVPHAPQAPAAPYAPAEPAAP